MIEEKNKFNVNNLLKLFYFFLLLLIIFLFIFYKDNKEIENITIKFDKNTALKIERKTLLCDATSECKIKMPNITPKEGYEVIGWSNNQNGKDIIYQVGKEYNIQNNVTLYAITKQKNNFKTITINFNKNTAQSIGNDNIICKSKTGCYIKMPSIIPKEGYEVIGWSNDNHSLNFKYEIDKTYYITSSENLYAITKKKMTKEGFLFGYELEKFKKDNNINFDSNIVVEKTIKSIKGTIANVYYVYDKNQYPTKNSLKNFKTYVERCINNLDRIDTNIIKKVINTGTSFIFFGSYTCDNAIKNVGYYTYSAYCNSFNRNIVVGYELKRFNVKFYEETILHEFGHAYDFTLRYILTKTTKSGISNLNESQINNSVKYLFPTNDVKSWSTLANLEAKAIKDNNKNFSLYSIEDLKERPHEYFAEVFNAYYNSNSSRNYLKTYAPLSYNTMVKHLDYIR